MALDNTHKNVITSCTFAGASITKDTAEAVVALAQAAAENAKAIKAIAKALKIDSPVYGPLLTINNGEGDKIDNGV